MSEKAVGLIEKENKIVFIVSPRASKKEIKSSVEKMYSVKVDSVNTVNDTHGRKKAFVKLSKDSKASDLATKLSII
jgi:large subunit ribosomal protein L23